MQNDLIKQWAQLSKKANESLKKINTLNTQSIKQLTKLQMDLVSSCLEGSIKKVSSVNKVSSVAELMNLQSTLYKELSEKVLENAQQSVKVAMETKKAMGELISDGLADIPEVVTKKESEKAAPKPVAKKAAPTPAAKKATPTPVAKKATPTPVAKKAAPKPAAKKATPTPVAKKAAPKPAAKKAAPKPVAKKAEPKPTQTSLQMPKPSGRPVTEGDAKK
ncbi:MAG: phasin family protein [Cycloclasticus sp.]|nr:phasin family protein [Cycloclasticus sp.]MBG95505.1 phasin family protein [Cycloclasticus sp.]